MKKNETSYKPEDLDSKTKNQDPDNYKWGVFYFNKNDSRVILPKRNPYLGVTLNFASPYTYLSLLAIIAVILIVEYFM